MYGSLTDITSTGNKSDVLPDDAPCPLKFRKQPPPPPPPSPDSDSDDHFEVVFGDKE